ncbi:unnamed protein product [Mytilus coruscus]|uniref:C-type lectin domain-containing protein n=1 Tax=Mytilus coruscus TaxID=42192 RepID=A0A6J8D060_MYTCO|nr:unnamed protein product [Mytilus coruscus]
MVIPYVIVVLCLVSPSTQFSGLNLRQGGFNIGPGLGGTRVFDDAESAAVIQTAPSFPAQVSVLSSEPDIGLGDGGGDGFGGILMMALPLLLLLGALGGGSALIPSPAPASPGSVPAKNCPVCATPVPPTCSPMPAQCNPKAACPASFIVVANGNPNKCYFVGSTDVNDYGAASAECARMGGSLLEHESSAELESVRTLITDSSSSYYIGYTDIGNKAMSPVGIYSGRGLPGNAGTITPACKFK